MLHHILSLISDTHRRSFISIHIFQNSINIFHIELYLTDFNSCYIKSGKPKFVGKRVNFPYMAQIISIPCETFQGSSDFQCFLGLMLPENDSSSISAGLTYCVSMHILHQLQVKLHLQTRWIRRVQY
jgi:hypothetical protein